MYLSLLRGIQQEIQIRKNYQKETKNQEDQAATQ
jgi:hypothetical protein